MRDRAFRSLRMACSSVFSTNVLNTYHYLICSCIFCCSSLNNGPTKVSHLRPLEPVTTLLYIEGLYKCDKALEIERL